MNKKKTEKVDNKCTNEVTAQSIGQMAGKILDHALELIDKRIAFATENADALDDLTDYLNSLEKDEMSRTEKNYLIQKISDLKLSKISDITSVISMCRDKLNADDEGNDNEMIFLIDYGDETSEIHIEEDLNEN